MGRLNAPKTTTSQPAQAPSAYAVRVRAERIDGVVVTRVYMTLNAAEAAVGRTRARGLRAALDVVQLAPVDDAAVLAHLADDERVI